eukprot:gene8659-6086_t
MRGAIAHTKTHRLGGAAVRSLARALVKTICKSERENERKLMEVYLPPVTQPTSVHVVVLSGFPPSSLLLLATHHFYKALYIPPTYTCAVTADGVSASAPVPKRPNSARGGKMVKGPKASKPTTAEPHAAAAPGTAEAAPQQETLEMFENSALLMQHCGFNQPNSSMTSLTSANENSISHISNDISANLGPKAENNALAIVKRGFRWQVLCALAMAHGALEQELRVQRLSTALRKNLLPRMLDIKEDKGIIYNKEAFRQAKNARKMLDLNPKVPSGKFIGDNYPMFDAFKSQQLLKSLSEAMAVEHVPADQLIARVGERSQDVIRFLVFGKVEYREVDVIRAMEELEKEREEQAAPFSPAASPRKEAKDAAAAEPVPPLRRGVLTVGSTIGGIFGTTACFDGRYRTISDCTFWSLQRHTFDSIFFPFADETMKEVYTAAFREHCVEFIGNSYPLPKCLVRVPIYRRINRPMSRYKDDFKPCVFLRGETLFEQDEGPGDVFCLLEGTVARRRRGFDKTFATGVSHLLSLNSFGAISAGVTGRFALLGADPIIMPATHRYQCTVMSRYALFFRITGEKFVSALLDDPNLYVQLRERLTQQIRTSMRLDPVCLRFAPLLRDFPEASLANIAQAAEPRVLRRSVPLCEPAQSIKEIFLIVRGEIRDTRVFGKQPTKRLDTPPPSDSEDGDEAADKRKAPTRGGVHFNLKKFNKGGTIPKNDTMNSTMRSRRQRQRGEDGGLTEEQEQNLNFFTSSQTMDLSRMTMVTPDEQSELNPTLPVLLDRRFDVTVGGGWEGLLVDKWPSGWEGVCTVEAWALPTLQIRLEFNSLPKPQQSVILSNARLQQKEALGLARIVVTRLPPMSSYQPQDKIVKAIPGPGIAGNVTESVSKKKSAQTSVSRARSAELSQSRQGRTSEGSNDQSFGEDFVHMLGPDNQKKAEKGPSTATAKPKKVKKAKKETKEDEAKPREEPLPEVKVVPPAELGVKIRRPKAVPTAPPPVDSFLLAVYNGEYKDGELALTNIVRDPPTPKKHDLRHCADLEDPMQRSSWPSINHPKKRWFATVPSYEPLPGTANNNNVVLEPLAFSTNTDLMTRKDKNYREKLVAETEFFTASMKSRQQLMTVAGDSFDVNNYSSSNTRVSPTRPQTQGRPKTGTQERLTGLQYTIHHQLGPSRDTSTICPAAKQVVLDASHTCILYVLCCGWGGEGCAARVRHMYIEKKQTNRSTGGASVPEVQRPAFYSRWDFSSVPWPARGERGRGMPSPSLPPSLSCMHRYTVGSFLTRVRVRSSQGIEVPSAGCQLAKTMQMLSAYSRFSGQHSDDEIAAPPAQPTQTRTLPATAHCSTELVPQQWIFREMASEKNWALSLFGGSIAEVSHEATHAASGAANLLIYDEQQLWIAGDAPQYVTLSLSPRRPAILYAGWNVWHDYLTNPRLVEISSGETLQQLEALTVCKALPGSGTQVWRLPRPIPPTHVFVRFTILETFGAGPTYMNNIILLSSAPDSRYKTYHPAPAPQEAPPPPQGSSSPPQVFSAASSCEGGGTQLGGTQGSMRQLLKDLDDDIRRLKPIKSLTPKKNIIFSMSPPAGLALPLPAPQSDPEEDEEDEEQARVDSPAQSLLAARVASLEQTVQSLTATVRHQQEDISMLKRLLLQQGMRQKGRHELADYREELQQLRERVDSLQTTRSAAPERQLTVDLPEVALRPYVEGVVGPTAEKLMKKLEKKLVGRLDRYLLDMVGTVSDTVEERLGDRLDAQRRQLKKLSRGRPASEPSTYYHYHMAAVAAPPPPSPTLRQPSPAAQAYPYPATPAQGTSPPSSSAIPGYTPTSAPMYSMAWASPALSIVKDCPMDIQAARQIFLPNKMFCTLSPFYLASRHCIRSTRDLVPNHIRIERDGDRHFSTLYGGTRKNACKETWCHSTIDLPLRLNFLPPQLPLRAADCVCVTLAPSAGTGGPAAASLRLLRFVDYHY